MSFRIWSPTASADGHLWSIAKISSSVTWIHVLFNAYVYVISREDLKNNYAHTCACARTCNYADCSARLWKGDELYEQRLITEERGKQSGELFAAWPLWNIQIILPPSTSLISAEAMSPVLATASFFHRVYRFSRVSPRSRRWLLFRYTFNYASW